MPPIHISPPDRLISMIMRRFHIYLKLKYPQLTLKRPPFLLLSPSIHKFGDELIHSGLSAALGHEPLGHELEAEWLGPSRVSNISQTSRQNTSPYLRIEALSLCREFDDKLGALWFIIFNPDKTIMIADYPANNSKT